MPPSGDRQPPSPTPVILFDAASYANPIPLAQAGPNLSDDGVGLCLRGAAASYRRISSGDCAAACQEG